MRIQHNISAMNAYRNYANNNSALSKNLEKLSSGYRINRAGDDAAGLAISEKMRAQISGLDQAQSNAKSGVNLVQTAEGALTEVHDMLNRMTTLANQSANGTYDNTTDRANLQKEVDQLKSEINRIADSTNFNGINLLDGKSLSGKLSEADVKYDTVSTIDGVTVGDVKNGGGSKNEFSLDVGKMFSEGDVLTLETTDSAGTVTKVNFEFSNKSGATASAGNQAVFGGSTLEEQTKNLASQITGQLGTKFGVSVDGTKITITANDEGTGADAVTKATVTNSDVSLAGATLTTTAGVDGALGNANKAAFEINGGTGTTGTGNLQAGDELTFNFTDANGNDLSAKITVTDDMVSMNSKDLTAAITEKLNDTYFEDNADTTGVDESKLKVGDLFELKANTKNDSTTSADGSIYVTGATGKIAQADGGLSAKSFEINRNGQKKSFLASEGQASTAATNSSAGTWKLDASKAAITNAKNFTKGDKVQFSGTLSNGSTFEIELTAGEDFEIDNSSATAAAEGMASTVDNIMAALQSDKATVKITNADNTTSTIKGSDLFGANGEFKITQNNDGQTPAALVSGSYTITSNNKGTAASGASSLTGMTVTPLDSAAVTYKKTLAEAQTSASSSFQVDEKLSYGSAIKVGDKTYEIVADARDTSSRNNTAIVVSDPTNKKEVAKALADAIGANESDYDVSSTADGKVTISSKNIGSDQKAMEISTPYGDKVKTATFKFDTNVVKEGSTMKANGNTYEFVKKGGTATTEGATAIEVDDFDKATAKDLADKFADVLKNGNASVAEDGTITLKSLEVDGKIADPSVSFSNNLTLQIGDTSASYNQLTVDLGDMHASAMGIEDIDIGTQEGAQAAVDVIKDAINYVSNVRGDLGAIQNRLEHTMNNLSVMSENITDAESNIRDTDVASEMMKYTKNNILIQSAQAMLAQANQTPQGVLQLLQ